MIVICTKCHAKFRVADERIGARGAKVRCSKCQTVFLVRPEGAPATEAAQAPEPAPAPGIELAPRTSPPPLPPPLPSARPPDPFAAFLALPAASPDPFAPAPSDPFAPAPSDPFAPAAASDPFAAPSPASDPFAPPPSPQIPSAASTDLGDLLGSAASAAPPPVPHAKEAAVAIPEDRLAREERAPSPARPAASAPFETGADPGYDAFADAQAFGPGALELGAPAASVPAHEAPFEIMAAAAPIAAPAVAPPATARAARSGGALPMAGADTHAPDRTPGRSRLRDVAVNAVALAALLVAAATILALWRTEGPIDASSLRPALLIAALRGGGANVPFATREVQSGLYERERAPPLLFVRGSVVSRAPGPVRRVRIRVELLRGGAVVASGQAIAGAIPTAEELWTARDADALAAVASATARRAPAQVRPGDALPFLVAIADQPADLAGTSLRVEAAPAGSGPP